MSAVEPKPEPKNKNAWADYERRKAEIPDGLSPDEYREACQKIAEELGI